MIAFFTRPINWLNILNRLLFTDQYLHLFSPGNLTQNLTRWLRPNSNYKSAHISKMVGDESFLMISLVLIFGPIWSPISVELLSPVRASELGTGETCGIKCSGD